MAVFRKVNGKMENMSVNDGERMDTLLEKCVKKSGLGHLLEVPVQLSGGLMHRMFRVKTEKGIFALKLLNDEIMKRPQALRNMRLSERAAEELKNTVPLAGAVQIQGAHVHCCHEHWFMIYPWLEGKSIFPPDIQPVHCAKIGQILADIHCANVQVDSMEIEMPENENREWKQHISLCRDDECKEMMLSLLPCILQWERKGYESALKLGRNQVISHRDLDPKNVMWRGMQPTLIDWEAAGYINPWQEMAECLFYWCDDGNGGMHKDCFQAFIEAYGKKVQLHGAPWQEALNAAYMGPVGWLYYNLRRTAGLEREDEVTVGVRQVKETLRLLQNRERLNNILLAWLQEY